MRLQTPFRILAALSFLFSSAIWAQAAYVVAVGDSLTAGDGDDGSGGGYPARLLTQLQTPYPGTTINNLAISGDTTQDLINKQLDSAVSALNGASAASLKIALVWIGSNDLFGLYASTTCDDYYASLAECESTEMGYATDNLDEIVSRLAATGAAVYLARLDDQSRRPVITDASLRSSSFPNFTADDIPRMSAQVTNYNSAVDEVSTTYSATTVDFYATTLFETWATLSDDGNHPNGAGYDAIADIWYAAITGGAPPTGDPDDPGGDCGEAECTRYLDSGSETMTLTGQENVHLRYLDFGGEDRYVVSTTLAGPVLLVDNQASTLVLPAGLNIEGAEFAADGMRFTTNGQTLTLLGRPQDFTFVFAGEEANPTAGIPLSYVATATLLGAYIPNPGAPPIAATVTGTVQPDGTLSTSGGDPNPGDASLLQPADFQYLGAFRLPDGGERPLTFEYGGNAMTFNPDGDPDGTADGYPGSLFITGHDRVAYGAVPDGGQIAEIDISAPVNSTDRNDLNTAGFLQNFTNVFNGLFLDREEIPRMGLEYLNHAATGPKLHAAWGSHQQETAQHGYTWLEPNLADPQIAGPWNIGDLDRYRLSGYIFEIPAAWADQHASGRYLGTGRFRDGGWSGMGPNLIAYRPWIDATGTPAAADTQLGQTTLLAYADSYESEDVTYHALSGYQQTDEWEGGAWITSSSGKSAVIFAGTKGTGAKYWYGYASLDGAGSPCVSNSYPVCWQADGSACPAADLAECHGTTDRGFWGSRWDAWIILYDPADLARVAAGEMESWEPQPYAHLDIDDRLYLNPDNVDIATIGQGDQRRFRIGATAYDWANDLLYVLELYADGAKPMVHVWRVR